MDNVQEESVIEIDFQQLLKVLLRKWWLIGILTLIGFVSTTTYAFLALEDVYTAESSMIVQIDSTSGGETYTNLSSAQKVVDTYTELAKSNVVLEELKTNLSIDLSVAQLKNMITINSVSNTSIIKIKVEGLSPILTRDIANEIISIIQQFSVDFNDLDYIEVLDHAIAPSSPSGPNRGMYVAVGILLGGMLGVGLVLAIEFSNKSIKTGKDMEDILGIRLLGSISEYDVDGGDEKHE